MAIKQIVNNDKHIAEAIDRLPQQYKDAPKTYSGGTESGWEGLIRSFSLNAQSLEDIMQSMLDQRGLDTAVGVNLDRIGQIVGEERLGRNDADYLSSILGKIAENNSDGTAKDIILSVKRFVSASVYEYFDLTIAKFKVTLIDPVLPINPRVYDSLNTAKVAGVGFQPFTLVPATEGYFGFSSDPNVDAFGFLTKWVGEFPFIFQPNPINGAEVNNGLTANVDLESEAWGFGDQPFVSPARSWSSISWSPELELFCACHNDNTDGKILRSTDGINWTSTFVQQAVYLRGMAWSPALSLFVAVGTHSSPNGYRSADGISWTSTTIVSNSFDWHGIIWVETSSQFPSGNFVAVGNNRISFSTNGTSWNNVTSPTSSEWSSVAYSPSLNRHCAVATVGGDRVMYSAVGNISSWTQLSSGMDSYAWEDIIWSDSESMFVAVGNSGRIGYSADGTSWTIIRPTIDAVLLSTNLTNIVWCEAIGQYIAGGGFIADSTFVSAFTITGTWTRYHVSAIGPQVVYVGGLEWAEDLDIFTALSYTGNYGASSIPDTRMKAVDNAWRFTIDGTAGTLAELRTKGLARENSIADITIKCSIYDSTGVTLIAESLNILDSADLLDYVDETTEYDSPPFNFNYIPLLAATVYLVEFKVVTADVGHVKVVGDKSHTGEQGQFSPHGEQFNYFDDWGVVLDLVYTDDLTRIDLIVDSGEDNLKFQVLEDSNALDFFNKLTSDFSAIGGVVTFTDLGGIEWKLESTTACPVTSSIVSLARVIQLEITASIINLD